MDDGANLPKELAALELEGRDVGGDEFVIHLPETKLRDAHKVRDRVDHDTNSVEIIIGKKMFHASAAVGIATIRPDELGRDDGAAYDLLFRRAESDMKARKAAGKPQAEERLMAELGITREQILEIESRGGLGDKIASAILEQAKQ